MLPPDPDAARERCARRAHWRRVDVRRHVSRELDALLRDLYPDEHAPRIPSTFGLTDDEIRNEANRLAAAGWPVAEVCAVLAVAPRQGVAA